jgi:hypothetical protein
VLSLRTGVDEVVSGSVIAVGYVDFTKDVPAAAVDAAMEQLHTTGMLDRRNASGNMTL